MSNLDTVHAELFEKILSYIYDTNCCIDIQTLKSLIKVSRELKRQCLNYIAHVKFLFGPKQPIKCSFLSPLKNLVRVADNISITINNQNDLAFIFGSNLRHFELLIESALLSDYSGTNTSYIEAFDKIYTETLIQIIEAGYNLSEYNYHLFFIEKVKHKYSACSHTKRVIKNKHDLQDGLISLQIGVKYDNNYQDGVNKYMKTLFEYLSKTNLVNCLYFGIMDNLLLNACQYSFLRQIYLDCTNKYFKCQILTDICNYHNITAIYHRSNNRIRFGILLDVLLNRNPNLIKIIIPFIGCVYPYINYNLSGIQEIGLLVNENIRSHDADRLNNRMLKWLNDDGVKKIYLWSDPTYRKYLLQHPQIINIDSGGSQQFGLFDKKC